MWAAGKPASWGDRRRPSRSSRLRRKSERRGTGRIRMSRVEDVAARSLIPFVQTTVAPGATVRTDGWSAYSGLANQGYDHQPRSISASGDPAHIVMPRVHRVAALLDRWWLGIHHGAIDADHLDYYLDEFTFRFNRRRSQARGLLFFRLLQQAVQHEPVPLQGPSRRSSQPRKPNVRAVATSAKCHRLRRRGHPVYADYMFSHGRLEWRSTVGLPGLRQPPFWPVQPADLFLEISEEGTVLRHGHRHRGDVWVSLAG